MFIKDNDNEMNPRRVYHSQLREGNSLSICYCTDNANLCLRKKREKEGKLVKPYKRDKERQ